MSAPVDHHTSHTALRAGAVAHRWAGVVGDHADALCAVGVRCDEDDRRVGESLVMELEPGRATPRVRLPFVVEGVAGTTRMPLLRDAHGALWCLDGDTPVHVLDDVIAIHGDLALTGDGRVVAITTDGTHREMAAGVRVLGDGVIVGDDGLLLIDHGVIGQKVTWTPPATVGVCHRRGDAIAVAGDGRLFVLDAGGATPLVRAVPGPALVHCLARAPDRWLLGSTVGGLLALEDDDDAIAVKRPSLRAHQLVRLGDGGFAAVSDLFIATSDDGIDWLGRDLTSVVRHFQG